jgi:hypothetical protein
MPAPAIPQNLYAQQSNGTVYLSWSLTAGATSYDVQRSTDGVSFASVATPSTNSYLDASVTINTLYYYQIAAVGSGGTSGYTTAVQAIPTLSGKESLGAIRLMAKQRADRVNSNFVTLPEWNSYINQSYYELYDLLTTVYEDYFLAPPLTFSTNGQDFQYDVPNGQNYDGAPALYKLYGVDCGLNTTDNAFISLNKYEFIDRNAFIFPNLGSTFYGVFNLKYRLMGDKLNFIPTPAGNQIIRVWYQPRLSILIQDTDVMDGISGWNEYVVVRAAKFALDKEESDSSKLDAELAFLKQRIEDSAMNRDQGQPSAISNVRNNSRFGRGGSQGGSWGGW